jgi:hypothetical protein
MIQLANEAGADPWFTVPHKVDDNYVRELARLIKRELNPDTKVYVEYSNELWNFSFDQTDWVNEQGAAVGLSTAYGEAAWRYTAKRSAEIFKIFEDGFGAEKDRLVKVLASQAANPWVSEQILEAFSQSSINGVDVNPWGITADALAIAPYFGGWSEKLGANIADTLPINVTVDEILDAVELTILDEVAGWIQGSKTVADTYGLDLIAYEGGQHLVASGAKKNIDSLTGKLVAANFDARMYDLYRKYLDVWFDNGGGLFVHFSYVRSPDEHGSWGVLRSQDQPIEEAPKYRALVDVIQEFVDGTRTPSGPS